MWSKICWEKNEPFFVPLYYQSCVSLDHFDNKANAFWAFNSECLRNSTQTLKRQTGNEEIQKQHCKIHFDQLAEMYWRYLTPRSLTADWGDFHVKDIKRVSYFPSERTRGSNQRKSSAKDFHQRWEQMGGLTPDMLPGTYNLLIWFMTWYVIKTVANPTEQKFISTTLSR